MRSRYGAKRDETQRVAFEDTLRDAPKLILDRIAEALAGVNGEAPQRDALRLLMGGDRGRTAALVGFVAQLRWGLPSNYGVWAFSHSREGTQRTLNNGVESLVKGVRAHGAPRSPQHQKGNWRRADLSKALHVKKR